MNQNVLQNKNGTGIVQTGCLQDFKNGIVWYREDFGGHYFTFCRNVGRQNVGEL